MVRGYNGGFPVRSKSTRSVLVLSAVIFVGCGRIGYELLDRPAAGTGTPGVGGRDAGADGSSAGTGGGSGKTADAASSGGSAHFDAAKSTDGSLRDSGGDSRTATGSGGTGGRSNASGGAAGTGGAPSSQPDAGSTTRIVDVTDPTQLVLSGAAQLGNGELDVTTNTRSVAGAAYLPNPYPIAPTTSFSVSFSFRLYGATGSTGDGFAVLWQNDPRGTAAIGPAGGALGYGGVSPSVDVEFDDLANSFDPSGNEIAITTNGQYTTALAYQSPPFGLADGTTHYVWVDYEASATTLSVYVANAAIRPSAALVTATVNLYAIVGSSAYIGFTAACGVSNEYAAIESFAVTYRP